MMMTVMHCLNPLTADPGKQKGGPVHVVAREMPQSQGSCPQFCRNVTLNGQLQGHSQNQGFRSCSSLCSIENSPFLGDLRDNMMGRDHEGHRPGDPLELSGLALLPVHPST